MKNNEYLQKYGEKALEVYKKTQRDSEQYTDKINHLIPKRNSSRKKSGSQKSLRHQKSKQKIKNTNQQPTFTFQRIGQNKAKNKLVISGLSTPKNNLGKSCNAHEDRKVSSSTKKKLALDSISFKLKDLVTKNKKSTKSMLTGVLQCLQMISQHEERLNQWLTYIKQAICYISEESLNYRNKWKHQTTKTHKLQKQIEELRDNLKHVGNKKSKVQQYALLAENQRLKEKISKMEGKIRDYEKKQMILISTLEQCNLARQDQMQYQANLPCLQKQFYQEQNHQDTDSQEDSMRLDG